MEKIGERETNSEYNVEWTLKDRRWQKDVEEKFLKHISINYTRLSHNQMRGIDSMNLITPFREIILKIDKLKN